MLFKQKVILPEVKIKINGKIKKLLILTVEKRFL